MVSAFYVTTLIKDRYVLVWKWTFLKFFDMQAFLKLSFSKYNRGNCKTASLCGKLRLAPIN